MEKLFFGYPLEQGWARDETGQSRDFCTAPDCPVGQSREILSRSRSSRSLLSRDLLSRGILVPGLSRRQSRGFAGPGSRQCPRTTAHLCSRIKKNLIEKFLSKQTIPLVQTQMKSTILNLGKLILIVYQQEGGKSQTRCGRKIQSVDRF